MNVCRQALRSTGQPIASRPACPKYHFLVPRHLATLWMCEVGHVGRCEGRKLLGVKWVELPVEALILLHITLSFCFFLLLLVFLPQLCSPVLHNRVVDLSSLPSSWKTWCSLFHEKEAGERESPPSVRINW